MATATIPLKPLQAFAFELYERFLQGATPEKLATETGISVARIQVRLDAAKAFFDRRRVSVEQHGLALVK